MQETNALARGNRMKARFKDDAAKEAEVLSWLSQRFRNALAADGLHNLDALLAATAQDIFATRNVGTAGLKEVRLALWSQGLLLRGDQLYATIGAEGRVDLASPFLGPIELVD